MAQVLCNFLAHSIVSYANPKFKAKALSFIRMLTIPDILWVVPRIANDVASSDYFVRMAGTCVASYHEGISNGALAILVGLIMEKNNDLLSVRTKAAMQCLCLGAFLDVGKFVKCGALKMFAKILHRFNRDKYVFWYKY